MPGCRNLQFSSILSCCSGTKNSSSSLLLQFQMPLYSSSILHSGFQPASGSRNCVSGACGSRHGIDSVCQLMQNLVDCCLFLPLLWLLHPKAAAACPAAPLLLLLLL